MPTYLRAPLLPLVRLLLTPCSGDVRRVSVPARCGWGWADKNGEASDLMMPMALCLAERPIAIATTALEQRHARRPLPIYNTTQTARTLLPGTIKWMPCLN